MKGAREDMEGASAARPMETLVQRMSLFSHSRLSRWHLSPKMLPLASLPPSATPTRPPAGGRGGARKPAGGGGRGPGSSKRLPPTNRRRPPPPAPVAGPTLEATLAALLAAGGAAPKRALGQNFLVDDACLDAIAAAPGLGPGDGVLEIGPGEK
jgi:hypothetical protein